MIRKNIHRINITVIVVIMGLLGFKTIPLSAQSGGDYDLSWSTIDGGGGTSSGGNYVLSGTVGQPDTGQTASCEYHLSGGFWLGPPCFVDLRHFARFSSQWLESGDVEANLDGLGDVDLIDLQIFVSHWLCYCPGDWPLY